MTITTKALNIELYTMPTLSSLQWSSALGAHTTTRQFLCTPRRKSKQAYLLPAQTADKTPGHVLACHTGKGVSEGEDIVRSRYKMCVFWRPWEMRKRQRPETVFRRHRKVKQ